MGEGFSHDSTTHRSCPRILNVAALTLVWDGLPELLRHKGHERVQDTQNPGIIIGGGGTGTAINCRRFQRLKPWEAKAMGG